MEAGDGQNVGHPRPGEILTLLQAQIAPLPNYPGHEQIPVFPWRLPAQSLLHLPAQALHQTAHTPALALPHEDQPGAVPHPGGEEYAPPGQLSAMIAAAGIGIMRGLSQPGPEANSISDTEVPAHA